MSKTFLSWLESRYRFLPVSLVFSVISAAIVLADIDKRILLIRLVEQAPHGDKVAHFVLFGLLATTLNIALQHRCFTVLRWRFQVGGFCVLLFSWGEEFSQIAIASRTFDLRDMLADTLGVLAAYWITTKMKS